MCFWGYSINYVDIAELCRVISVFIRGEKDV